MYSGARGAELSNMSQPLDKQEARPPFTEAVAPTYRPGLRNIIVTVRTSLRDTLPCCYPVVTTPRTTRDVSYRAVHLDPGNRSSTTQTLAAPGTATNRTQRGITERFAAKPPTSTTRSKQKTRTDTETVPEPPFLASTWSSTSVELHSPTGPCHPSLHFRDRLCCLQSISHPNYIYDSI